MKLNTISAGSTLHKKPGRAFPPGNLAKLPGISVYTETT